MRLILSLSILFFSKTLLAEQLGQFIKNSGYGAAGGAVVGVVSLAFVDKPSENLNNISKGAALGLYAGIGYGIYQLFNPRPTIEKNYIDEVQHHLLPTISSSGDWNIIAIWKF